MEIQTFCDSRITTLYVELWLLFAIIMQSIGQNKKTLTH